MRLPGRETGVGLRTVPPNAGAVRPGVLQGPNVSFFFFLLALVQTVRKRTTRTSAARDGRRRHEGRTGRHGAEPDGQGDTRSPAHTPEVAGSNPARATVQKGALKASPSPFFETVVGLHRPPSPACNFLDTGHACGRKLRRRAPGEALADCPSRPAKARARPCACQTGP